MLLFVHKWIICGRFTNPYIRVAEHVRSDVALSIALSLFCGFMIMNVLITTEFTRWLFSTPVKTFHSFTNSVSRQNYACAVLVYAYQFFLCTFYGVIWLQSNTDFHQDFLYIFDWQTHFLYPPHKKWRGIMTSFPDSNLSSFVRFSSNFVWTLISGRSGLGLQMG